MEETKLTVRVPKRALAAAKAYAAENNTTLTRMITVYLQKFEQEAAQEENTISPVVQRLTGLAKWNEEDGDYRDVYHRYLEEKYGEHARTD